MEGTIFILCLWSCWIVATFLMPKKHPARLEIAFFSLCALICLPYSLRAGSFLVNMPLAAVFIYIYISLSKLAGKVQIYTLGSMAAVMIGSVGLKLLELYDPVWSAGHEGLYASGFAAAMSMLLHPRSVRSGMICAAGGILHGDMLYSALLKKWGIVYPIGSYHTLDIAALSVSALLIASYAFKAAVSVGVFTTHTKGRQQLRKLKRGQQMAGRKFL